MGAVRSEGRFREIVSVAGSLFKFVVIVVFQVLSALDILQPPHLDFFQEMYPFVNVLVGNVAAERFVVRLKIRKR